ncbi:MAG: HD domain-containing protein [Anaerolineales bacterium]|nr:HD domain-containing protein [Anaerolineales bacterium]
MNSLNREEIWQLLCEYTQSDLLRKHMLAVEAAMKWYARKFGEDENLWGNIGLVHDFAYEKFPDQHPQKDGEILRELGFPEDWVRAIWSHGDRLDIPRVTPLEKTLYAVDELTGLVLAVALVRPSKKLADVEVASVKKKWKDKAFARGVNREDIAKGADALGVPLDEHIGNVLAALKENAQTLGV